MRKKEKNFYFSMFEEVAGFCYEEALLLQKCLTDYDHDKLAENTATMHKLENAADASKHKLMKKLAHEFITPIEREDIIGLSQYIDEITDSIEDVLLRMYMFDIKVMRPDAPQFCAVIVKSCEVLKQLMAEFHNFKKSGELIKLVIDINSYENEGDKLYIDAMRELYTSGADPIEMLTWNEIYKVMEECVDKCEHAANMAEEIMMKNS